MLKQTFSQENFFSRNASIKQSKREKRWFLKYRGVSKVYTLSHINTGKLRKACIEGNKYDNRLFTVGNPDHISWLIRQSIRIIQTIIYKQKSAISWNPNNKIQMSVTKERGFRILQEISVTHWQIQLLTW